MLANQTTRTFVTIIVPRFPWSLNNSACRNVQQSCGSDLEKNRVQIRIHQANTDLDPTLKKPDEDPAVKKIPDLAVKKKKPDPDPT